MAVGAIAAAIGSLWAVAIMRQRDSARMAERLARLEAEVKAIKGRMDRSFQRRRSR